MHRVERYILEKKMTERLLVSKFHSVDDLDKESFDIFRQEALRSGRMTKEYLDISNTELFEKLDLMEDGKLKRAGALCFYHRAEKVIRGCYVKSGAMSSNDFMTFSPPIPSIFFNCSIPVSKRVCSI